MLHMRVLQGAGNRDYCAVATQSVSKRNPCWPGWRSADGRGQCVYACHRALESSMTQTDASDFYNIDTYTVAIQDSRDVVDLLNDELRDLAWVGLNCFCHERRFLSNKLV